jgi:hypothetical protein
MDGTERLRPQSPVPFPVTATSVATAIFLGGSNAAFAADRRCRLIGNPIDFQSTVVHDRRLTTQSGHLICLLDSIDTVIRRHMRDPTDEHA